MFKDKWGEFEFKTIDPKKDKIEFWKQPRIFARPSNRGMLRSRSPFPSDEALEDSFKYEDIQIAPCLSLNSKTLKYQTVYGHKRINYCIANKKCFVAKVYKDLDEKIALRLSGIENVLRIDELEEEKGRRDDHIIKIILLEDNKNPDDYPMGNYPKEIIRACAQIERVGEGAIRNRLYAYHSLVPKQRALIESLSPEQSRSMSKSEVRRLASLMLTPKDIETPKKVIELQTNNLTPFDTRQLEVLAKARIKHPKEPIAKLYHETKIKLRQIKEFHSLVNTQVLSRFNNVRRALGISQKQATEESMKMWIKDKEISIKIQKELTEKGNPPSKKQITKSGDIGIIPKDKNLPMKLIS